MATLISKATGNWTSAATWAVADATSELDSDSNTTNTTTSLVASQSFTPGAITVDAIAVKLSGRSSGPTGTFTVELYNATAAAPVAGGSATVNVADLPLRGGWVVLTLAAPVLLLAATNYQVRVVSSTSGQVTLFRNATANNWSRQLRTTTTAAPAAGDKLIVAGEHTGAGSGNDFVVTMNSTASTSYGSTAFPQSLHISKRATLQYGVAASTNYHLKIKGLIHVREGGTFTIGTSSTPIPSTSSALLEFDIVATTDSGIIVNAGTFRTGGNALSVSRTTLAADAAVAATTLTTAVSTGWLSGDEIGIFPTKRAGGESEIRQLSANATGASVPVTAGLTYAHDGIGVYAGEVVNLSRNVKIRGTSQALTGYYQATNEATTDCSWTEFKWLGHNSTTGRRGITLSHTGSGMADLVNCSMHQYATGNSIGVYQDTASTANITVTDCSMIQTGYIAVYLSTGCSVTPNGYSVTGLWTAGATSYGLYTTTPDMTVSDCRLSAVSYCLYLVATGLVVVPKLGPVTNILGRAGSGFYMQNVGYGAASNLTMYRASGIGLTLTGCELLTIDTMILEGSQNGGLSIANCVRCTLSNASINSGAGFTSAYGVYIAGPNHKCVLASAGIGTTLTHATGDIVATGDATTTLDFQGCTFGSATEFTTNGVYLYGLQYSSQRHQGIAGSNKIVRWEGTLRRDTTIVDVAPSSVRLTPSRTTHKLKGTPIPVSVQSGQSCSISVKIRKSVVGDGTAYNGAQPRIVVLSNPSAGITYDTVVATASGAAGSWETVSGTTAVVSEDCVLEFVVDCDGTQGWINYDTPTALSYSILGESWAFGAPFMTGSSLDLTNFTDVPTDKVELNYQYKYNSTSNNRTGTRRQPATGEVKTGVLYGPSDSLTGTYDGSDRWTDPGIANVRSGVQYKVNSLTNNRTGDVNVPAPQYVKINYTYDTLNSVTGTYDGSDRWSDPGESVVLENIQYKANSLTNNKTGTLDLSSVATATAAAVWNTNLTSYTTANTAGLILRTALIQLTNLISLSWIRRR
jgi:hypothetical protein